MRNTNLVSAGVYANAVQLSCECAYWADTDFMENFHKDSAVESLKKVANCLGYDLVKINNANEVDNA